jgi:hypothetical protein
MRIEMEDMRCWPDRDAGFYYAANVFDDAGIRYPVRIMIAGIAIALFKKKSNIESSYSEVVQSLYRQELEALVKQGRLVPANSQSTVNVVFLVNRREDGQIRDGDIVIDDVVEKLEAAESRRGGADGSV